ELDDPAKFKYQPPSETADNRLEFVLRYLNMAIRLRIYDKPDKTDGRRVLVDRLWPRGLTQKEARIDDWLKEITPSAELGKWFRNKQTRWRSSSGDMPAS